MSSSTHSCSYSIDSTALEDDGQDGPACVTSAAPQCTRFPPPVPSSPTWRLQRPPVQFHHSPACYAICYQSATSFHSPAPSLPSTIFPTKAQTHVYVNLSLVACCLFKACGKPGWEYGSVAVSASCVNPRFDL